MAHADDQFEKRPEMDVVDIAAPDRLARIAQLNLYGHLGHPELETVVATLSASCSVPIAVINVVTPDLQTYPAETGVGAPCTQVPDTLSFCAEVVRTGRGLQVPDASRHPVYADNPLVKAGVIGSYAGEPLVHGGHVIGAVSIFDETPRHFTAREHQSLRTQARVAASVIAERAATAVDRLTGLASRTAMLDLAGQALAQRRSGGSSTTQTALMVLDVVDMAGVNKALGSAGGDRVLCAVAERIAAACGPDHRAARIGGDRFAVLFGPLASEADARVRAAAVLDAASAPVDVAGDSVVVAWRAGLTVAPCDSADALLAAAERAAAAGSSSGGTTLTAEGVRSRQIAELRCAIAGDQLVLHYHPVITLATRRVTGVEALVRWQHPQRGLLPPSEFIPLAEDSGLIGELGDWVMRTAAVQASTWRTAGRLLDVAINLSPRQMSAPGFADRVLRTLRELDAPVDQLIFEVTETAIMDQPDAQETLRALHDSGIRLALDDFGTGYCSLAYLRRFAVDLIKIDRSFVSGLGRHGDDDAIVASIVSLAHNTHKGVIAEGVETTEQEELLRQLGVEQAQGFLWTPPLPAGELGTWLAGFESTPPTRRAEAVIWQMNAQGASRHTIAAALNAEGLRTSTGMRWSGVTVASAVLCGSEAATP